MNGGKQHRVAPQFMPHQQTGTQKAAMAPPVQNSVRCQSLLQVPASDGKSHAWSGAAPGSPNADILDCGDFIRVPVGELAEGTEKKDLPEQTWDERLKKKIPETIEPADHRAIVIIPKSVIPPPGGHSSWTVEVLLHLHGFSVGSRFRDAYDKDDPTDESFKPKTVRDLELDRIGQQLAASKRKMIAVLAQGTRKSEFGPNGVNSDKLIKEALEAAAIRLGLPTPQAGKVVLSAHSGGGGRIAEMLPVKGYATKGSLPANLKALFLFDAIDSGDDPTKWYRLGRVREWVLERLEKDIRTGNFESSPRLRAIHSPGYSGSYQELNKAIRERLTGLPKEVKDKLEKKYSVSSARTSHPHVLEHGDALQRELEDLP